eukprot:TRINITY_DN4266_c0_g1_i9.p2 TRINITY_DN4266_c0_g1~~TRINITY_DN4266_c0_g1_i9.p2  ORF type:complete len:248 (+),score=15.29 TRINITY_DN4266_c0_g1_i9:85-744(+)
MVDKVKLRQEVPPTSSAGSSNNSDQVKESAPSQQPEEKPSINYFSLYRYADRVDIVLIIFGFLGAVVNGLTLPAFTVIFGELVNELGEDSPNLTEQVNDLALYFVYLAIVSWAASYFEVGFWMWSGARQAATIRKKYLQAILKQDITFFDRYDYHVWEIQQRESIRLFRLIYCVVLYFSAAALGNPVTKGPQQQGQQQQETHPEIWMYGDNFDRTQKVA